jgi:hypothetical protein
VIYADAKNFAFGLRIDPFHGSDRGKFRRKVDEALPDKPEEQLYNGLNRTDPAVPTRLRAIV